MKPIVVLSSVVRPASENFNPMESYIERNDLEFTEDSEEEREGGKQQRMILINKNRQIDSLLNEMDFR